MKTKPNDVLRRYADFREEIEPWMEKRRPADEGSTVFRAREESKKRISRRWKIDAEKLDWEGA